MSTVKKVIIRKTEDKYTWSQTDDSLTILLPIKNVLLKNIDVLYTPDFLKVNAPSIKYFAVVDFSNPIDYENGKNRVQLQDERLEVFLMKHPDHCNNWESINVQGLTKEEMMKRREESLKTYYAREDEKYKEAEKKKLQMDKHTIDQQMKVENYQRKQLKQKKEEEKQRVEQELYRDLDEIEHKNEASLQHYKQPPPQKEIIQSQQVKDTNKENTINGKELAAAIPTKENKAYSFKQNDPDKNIFTEDDIIPVPQDYKPETLNLNHKQAQNDYLEQEQQQLSYEQEVELLKQEEQVHVPDVRSKQDVKVPFTEKKFPNLPARESHQKEAPYPKSKNIEKKKDNVYIDIEDKDPVWLKDKGDHFYTRNDYHSALNAYSKALEMDKEFIMCRLNRATTWLRVRQFDHCIDDCGDIETHINALKEEEKQDEFYQKMLARIHAKKGAAYSWLSKFDLAVESLEQALHYKGIYGESELQEIQNDIERIKIRQKAALLKTEGDQKFAESLLDEAMHLYQQSLEIDSGNEYAYSNIGLIHMMRQDYNKCIEFSTKALEIIEEFMNDTKLFSKENRLEVKILLRRGKSYEQIGDIEKSKQDLDRAILLDPQNGEARALHKKVQEKLDNMMFDQYNKQANEYQRQLNFAGALEYYEKCLKIQKKGHNLDNIAIYVNKIACLLSLEKHDRVITECNDALRIIRNYRNRFEEKQSPDEKKRLLQMEIRVSVRRGNALAKLNRVSEAVQEYERALKMDPHNEAIKKDLDVLRKGS